MIQINLFNSSENKYRLPLVKAALKELASIKEDSKKEIQLYVYCHENDNELWEEILYPVVEAGIEATLASMPTDAYEHKMQVAQQTTTEYFCKWDDDVFVNRYVWDYMIENRGILNDPTVSVLAPTLSNGMPSVELFVEDFLTEQEKEDVHKIFLKDNIDPNIFGCNYSEVFDYIENLDTWNGEEYWKLVDRINPVKGREGLPWFYSIVKGVHPARFSYDYNMYIAKHASENKELILNNSELFLEKYLTPYFCNNLFIAKTEFYLEAQKVFFDNWDEGQLTMYANRTDKSPVYVRNCYGIHMAYGCTVKQKEIEKYYIDNLFSTL